MTPDASRGPSALDALQLRDIPEDGLRFEEPLPESWLAPRLAGDHGLAWQPVGAGQIALEVRALGPVDRSPPVRVWGSASTHVRTDCVRCLAAVHQSVAASIDITLFSDRDPEPGEPTASGLDEGRYDGGVVPLPEILREHVLLELDMNPTCTDTPACDRRTRALLEEANRPAREMDATGGAKIDPRWAPLADLEVGDPD